MGVVHETIFTWDSRDIRLTYTPRMFGVIDHVGLQSVDGRALPVTQTGYRSHFFGPVEPALTLEEAVAMARDWIEREACSKAWQDQAAASRQLDLF